MQDRTPKHPGRIKLVPVDAANGIYDLVRADEPTQTGDPLNKNTFLKDETAALFGMDEMAVPNDIFGVAYHLIMERANVVCGTYEGTGTWGENNPCTLTFDFNPKLVVFLKGSELAFDYDLLARPIERATWYTDNTQVIYEYACHVSWGENSVSWWAVPGYPDAPDEPTMIRGQKNNSGETYYYIAIG